MTAINEGSKIDDVLLETARYEPTIAPCSCPPPVLGVLSAAEGLGTGPSSPPRRP